MLDFGACSPVCYLPRPIDRRSWWTGIAGGMLDRTNQRAPDLFGAVCARMIAAIDDADGWTDRA